MALKDFKFENLSRAAQFILFACLGFALAGVFYVYYLRGLLEQRDMLRGEVAKLEASVTQARAIAVRLEQFKTDLARLDERMKVLRSILPSEKETPQVLRSVQQMAASSNLTITKFGPQRVLARSFYSDWPIQVEVQGSYDALGSFFEKISQATRIINVDNLAIRGIEGSTDPSRTLNAVCTATTFVYHEEKDAPPPAKRAPATSPGKKKSR